ncbi:hypothetical protein G6011_00970 [Alternaria panax]|uniref:Uncharacterized protein n=1 Tax=Alternaria panax TaxID=48097 RepID=A0AAD4NVJ0_9PLEO|nr:hypothetical protein G6011_00970 [Alternaria panax]
MFNTVASSRRLTRNSADTSAPKMHIQELHAKAKADRENIARPSVAVAHSNTDAASKTTFKFSIRHHKSSLEPDSDERGVSSETKQTSHHGSNEGNTAQKLSKMLTMLNWNYAILRDNLDNAKRQLIEKNDRYQALEQKYAEQRGQRINDKHLVDTWAQEAADANARCENVDSAKRDLEDRLTEAKATNQADVGAKDCEIETLKADHEIALAVKDAETEKWHRACLQKDSAFQTAVTKLTTERDETQAKANREKKKIWNTSRIQKDALKAELEGLRIRFDRMAADSNDANFKERETIVGLVARNQQLEMEHGTMSRMLQHDHTKGSERHQLHSVIEASTITREQAQELRATVRQLEEQNENILDTLQNVMGDCTRHQEAERDMRAELHRTQSTMQLLEDKLAFARTQVRDATKQLEQMQQNAVPAGAHCVALDMVEQENENLRDLLQAERNEKMDMQVKLDKLDSENLSLSIEHDSIEAELIGHKKSSSTLRDSTEASMHELNMLRKGVHGQQGVLGEQEHRELLNLVTKTTKKNKALEESTAEMEERMQTVERYGATIKDKFESEVMKAKNHSEYAWHLYYNEAVPTTERLHAEIAALKAEKGEQHFVEPTPPANPVVFDRKTLPCAVYSGLAGVPAHLITSAVYEAEGSTRLSATAEALETLRPQGRQPVVVAGKVWLSRLVKPFSEEEAVMQIEADRHQASLGSAVSGQSSVSNTYAPRNHHILTNASIYNGLPADDSESQTPFLVHTSSKRAHSPVIAKRDNQTAARCEPAQSTTMQAPQPQPRIVRCATQTIISKGWQVPEYQSAWQELDERMTREAWEEFDDGLKIDWVKLYVVTEND